MTTTPAPASGMTEAHYPAAWGRPVQQRHADECAVEGHKTWTRDGEDVGICPRCGAVTHPRKTVTA